MHRRRPLQRRKPPDHAAQAFLVQRRRQTRSEQDVIDARIDRAPAAAAAAGAAAAPEHRRHAAAAGQAGDTVLRGQRIGAADGNVSSAVHSPTSGRVVAVEQRPMPHASGLSAPSVVIEPDGDDRPVERELFDWHAAGPGEVRDFLRDAGVVGLGGAVFPSHLKLAPGKRGATDTLVINGAECEPFITCDDMLMRAEPKASCAAR
jgi:Na+-translocating ferredoxin:NAD+ oxidoreductase RnfC subunit